MELIHYQSPIPNFGDDLNACLWPALAPDLFARDEPGRGFVGIGTIIGMPVKATRLDVLSSGVGYDPVARWAGKQVHYHAVRGPLSAGLLGLDKALALTDGAVLTPHVPGFPSAQTGGRGVAVIPHYQSLEGGEWEEACAMAGFGLIDPRQGPLEVVTALSGADLVLAESLHGAILADTYGVPWRAFAVSRNFSVPKWVDWTASLGLELQVTLVPPPSAAPLLRYGRRAEPIGTCMRFSLAEGLAELQARLASQPAPPWRARLTRWRNGLLGHPLGGRLLGYSPARTAEALAALALSGGHTSAPALRAQLAEALTERLDLLVHETLAAA